MTDTTPTTELTILKTDKLGRIQTTAEDRETWWAVPFFYDTCNVKNSGDFLCSAAAPREWVPLLVGAEGGPALSSSRFFKALEIYD